jgi:hypothetical protein
LKDPAEPAEEVDVREALADDVVAMCALGTRAHVDERAVRAHIATLVSARTRGTFVAVTSDGTLMGWAHAEVASPARALRGRTTGSVQLLVAGASKRITEGTICVRHGSITAVASPEEVEERIAVLT